ncbi:MAG TPA: 2,3-bisphosphoglycerate-independent phosphoglycerate mutase [Minicystis sp.]|nr:2,3-bisphosphoglycerate-independent phosphoglycerate mutase [Minicystis sp.]
MSDRTPGARPRPLVLCILDGFGERAEESGNAIKLAKTPSLDELAKYPHTTIGTSGPDVGLPPGQMGNSEVGHLNFGAGRIAQMDITRIDALVAEHAIASNPVIFDAIFRAKQKKCRLHLLGLVSNGGVHSSIEHLYALIDAAHYEGVPVVVHAFLDGRDTPPKSAGEFIQKLEYWLEGKGTIGTVAGRYWAMDRDKRWERVQRAFTAIVRGKCEQIDTAFEAISLAYSLGRSDEFVDPMRIGDYEGVVGDFMADFAAKSPRWDWYGEEVALAFNFRPDRMREIVAMLVHKNLPEEAEAMLVDRGKKIYAFDEADFFCMTEYDPKLGLKVAFPKEEVKDSFGEIVARAGLHQFRCAETEKYAHVTYFFNGGREAPFEGEERKLVPSPRDVPTYDKKPEMSEPEVTASVVAAIESGKYDFVLVNFANPDMVGHTGDLKAAIRAVEAVDAGLGRIMAAVRGAGGALLVTSDHGNCEQMKDAQGKPHTAHTTNRVPFYYMNEADAAAKLRGGGRICDVAPTMLAVLGLAQPEAMTGASLLDRG